MGTFRTRLLARLTGWIDALRRRRAAEPFVRPREDDGGARVLWASLYEALAWLHIGAARLVRLLDAGWCALGARARMPFRLALGFSLLAVIALWVGLLSQDWIQRWMLDIRMPPELHDELRRLGVLDDYDRLCLVAREVGMLCLAAAGLAFTFRRLSYQVFKVAWAAFATLYCWVFWFMLAVPSRLHDFDHTLYGKTARNEHWMLFAGYWCLFAVIPYLVVLAVGRKVTSEAYSRRTLPRPLWGDRVAQSLRTGGRDPQYRSSGYWAIALWLCVLVLPAILRGCGMEEPYGLIKGKGEPAVQAVVKMQKRPKKPKKKLVVNPWSPYILQQPKIDDITVLQELEEMTSDRWVAQTGKTGKLGKGGKGPGGWPHGMENATVRFIRLEYAGGDWDQDMGKNSDYNLLIRFHEITGFRIAKDTEHLAIRRLKRFPKDRAPPFVFLTGKGNIQLTSAEVKVLRWYCLEEGGCLFIDNGGGQFHLAMTRMLRRVFPDKSLRDIANDDPIFQAPFLFPDGAPPLWHHGGRRALGIRHNGRWVVFYHPGDMNDAWKTGHSGVSKEVAEHAYRLGINVMYYTFNQYHRLHFED